MSLIFDRVPDAFKFIGFHPNFKHNSLRAFADPLSVIRTSRKFKQRLQGPSRTYPNHDQGHQPQSGTSSILQTSSNVSSIFESVLDAFKLNRFQPNFKNSSIRACGDNPKRHQGHQRQSGTSKSSSSPTKNLQMSSIFEGVLDAFNFI